MFNKESNEGFQGCFTFTFTFTFTSIHRYPVTAHMDNYTFSVVRDSKGEWLVDIIP